MSERKIPINCEVCGINQIKPYRLVSLVTDKPVTVYVCQRCYDKPNRATWLRWRKPST